MLIKVAKGTLRVAVVASKDSPLVLAPRASGNLLRKCRKGRLPGHKVEAFAISADGAVMGPDEFIVVNAGEADLVEFFVRLEDKEAFNDPGYGFGDTRGVIYDDLWKGSVIAEAECLRLHLKLLDSRGRSDTTRVVVRLPKGEAERPRASASAPYARWAEEVSEQAVAHEPVPSTTRVRPFPAR